jgi:hypothetical protein
MVAQLIPTYHPKGDSKKLKTSSPKTPPIPWIRVLSKIFKGFVKTIKVRITKPAMIKNINRSSLVT